MAKDNSVLYLIVAMVIIVALVTPSLMATGANMWDDLKDFIRGGWQDWSTGTGSTGLSLEIHYTDGSSNTFKPDTKALLPLTISDTGGTVLKVTASLEVEMTLEGTLSNWDSQALLVANIKQGSAVKVGSFKTWVITKTGTSWSTASKTIGEKAITAEELEDVTRPLGEGNYQLVLVFDLTMKVTFTDGTTETKGASAVPCTWTYEYTTDDPTQPAGAIKSLSVNIGIARLRP